MKKHFFVFIMACIFLYSSGLTAEQDNDAKKFELKYNLAKGFKFTISTVSNTDGSQGMGGREMTYTMKDEHVYSFEVLSVDEGGNMTLEMEYKKRYTEMPTQEGQKVDEHPDFIGKKVQFVLAPDGELSGFSGFEKLPGGMDKNGDIKENKSASYIRGIINLFPKTPSDAVEIGGTWDYEYSRKKVSGDSSVTNIATNYSYKLIGEETFRDRNCLKIEVDYTSSEKGKEFRFGMIGNVEMEAEGTQTIMFDNNAGLFLSLNGSSTDEGTVEVPSQGVLITVANDNNYSRTVEIN